MSTNDPQKLSFQELDQLNQQFDEQLREINGGDSNKNQTGPTSFSIPKILLKLFMLALGLVAPFVVLVRTSIFMYSQYQLNGWFALAMGILATVLLLVSYWIVLTLRYGNGNVCIHKYVSRGIVLLVLSYTLYGLLYYSSLNTKTEQIRSYYRGLHPIMRVALATTTLAESDLLVTDIQREPEDYARMGLPQNQRSLHFKQPDGYVHAVDLRTKGRAEWKNWFTRILLKIAGLKTFRHVGTADHLHVYLPLND